MAGRNNNWYSDISLFHDGCVKLLQCIGRHMENKIITILFVVLILIGLSGCGVKNMKKVETEAPTVLESVGKMEGIGMALGCMFIPEACQDIVNKDGNTK
tara:strand:- start:260 stop:559 length:300 start_codon:yes stop_codon:yes gene_type:complete